MEQSRDQILLDFQSCTGMEDIPECIGYLEATDWNLLDAINNVMPKETQTLPSEQLSSVRRPSVEEIVMNENPPAAALSMPNMSPILPRAFSMGGLLIDGAPPPPYHNRLLNFTVKYKDKTVNLEVPDTETIGSIKTALFTKLGVPPCYQELCGFHRNHTTDETPLLSLNLQTQTHLQLNVPLDCPPSSSTSSLEPEQNNFADCLTVMYELDIQMMDNPKLSEHKLKFAGSKTVSEVKQDIYAVTNIPVRHQRWMGWPDQASDENMTLAAINLNFPVHNLQLWDLGKRKGRRQPVVDITDSASSGEEFEDATEGFSIMDDSIFQGTIESKKPRPLMQDNIEDEAEAVSQFSQEFENRYGPCHPHFFAGTLAEALQSSCQKPAKERRPLIVYLHHDASVLSNVFCTQLLCTETISTYLTVNFLTWAWDLTFNSNKTRFLSSVTQHLGVTAASAIRQIALNDLPAFMIIGRVRSTTEVITVIPGNVTLDELMTRLLHGVEVFSSGLATEIREEEERQAREQVKQEQDKAYEESLLADRLKDQARQQERELRQKQEEAERMQKEQEEQEKQKEEAVKEENRQMLAQQLPREPPEDCKDPITCIRIRLPSGDVLVRRFLGSQPLKTLLLYLASKGFPASEYKVLASWPRRDLSALDTQKSFKELNLFPQEMVTLEERENGTDK